MYAKLVEVQIITVLNSDVKWLGPNHRRWSAVARHQVWMKTSWAGQVMSKMMQIDANLGKRYPKDPMPGRLVLALFPHVLWGHHPLPLGVPLDSPGPRNVTGPAKCCFKASKRGNMACAKPIKLLRAKRTSVAVETNKPVVGKCHIARWDWK